MTKYLNELLNYWQYKVIAGLWTVIFQDELPVLFLLFIFLEVLDIFSRWLALSRKCWTDLYPQTPCSTWKAFCWLWQSRKWRYIKSTGLRDGFCDKMLVYLILLLLSATVDGALALAHVPRALLSIVTTVLVTTEALSVMENLSEAGVEVITTIKDKFTEKFHL